MKTQGKKIINILLFCIVCACFMACRGDDDCFDGFNDGAGADYYLQLCLNANYGGTRADSHPWGGESGDGNEEARNHENDITNITLFIYTDESGRGVNSDGTTPIKFAHYYSGLLLSSTDGSYVTEPLRISNYKKDSKDRVIILANMGDMSSLSTLGDVRDAMVEQAWSRNGSSIKDYYNFAMSSAIDNSASGILNFTPTGEYFDPFTATVDVERVAARIDLWLINQAESMNGAIEYEVGTTGDKLLLSHVRIVNGSVAPTYTLKRTSESVNPIGTLNYLGDETITPGTHIPSNYVVEPLTSRKHSGSDVTTENLESWYGESSLANSMSTGFLASPNYRIHGYSADSEVFGVNETADIDGDGSAEGNIKCYTVGYVMENTMDKSGQMVNFMTGLEFKGTYVPSKIYKWNASAESIEDDDTYVTGSDFWYFESKTADKESLFFSSLESLVAYAAANTDITYEMHHYVKGECYYYVWIRHAMYNEPDYKSGKFPMEYGIVRNNIYRIGVRAVSQIGPEVPTPELGDRIKSTIYVRDWRFRKHEEISL